MRSLVIAPKTDLLHAQDEAETIINLLKAHSLIGKVDLKFLLNHLLDNQYDYIHLITHVNENGVLLSDEECSLSAFAQVIALSKPKILFLNTCHSYELARILHEMLPRTSIVTTIGEVLDKDAYANGVAFVRALIENNYNAAKAYEKSVTRSKTNYIFIPNTISVEEYPMFIESGKLLEAIIDLGQKINEYNMRATQIREELHNLHRELKKMEAKIERISYPVHPRPIFLVMGYLSFSFSMLFLVGAHDIFNWIDPYQKIGVVLFLQCVALVFFARGLEIIQDGDK
jgi:hypothetical protein